MKLQLGTVIGAVLLLTGCDDDSGPEEPPVLSGIFQAGNVQGVHYRTPTLDGLTDSSGTFKYQAGETVVFSVGAVRMGSAPGAATITPFTLAGLTPPATETALRRELDRASRTTSSFVRAVNIQRFLLALDADHDSTNGIDVRGNTRALANATVNFDQPVSVFAGKLDKAAPNLTHNMPRWYPIVHLYHALGIVVPAHVPVEIITEQSLFSTWTTAISYFPDGSRKSQDSFDAFQGSEYSQSYTYDTFGRRTSSRFESRPYLSGGFSEVEQWIFDERGTLSRRLGERDEGRDGVIDFSMVVAHEYGDYNNLLRQQTRQYSGDDETVDRFSDYQTLYDDNLNSVRTVSEDDNDANGVVDSRWIQTIEYDASNRPVSQVSEFDELADGTVDTRETWTVTYDVQGAGAVETYQRDENADGVFENVLTYRWTYDGSRLRTVEVTDTHNPDTNGAPASRLVQTLTYDDDARVVREDQSQDWDGIAGFDTLTRVTYTYTDFGGVLRQESESDGDADGQVDTRYTTDYQYGADGDLHSISNAHTSRPLWTPTTVSSTQFTNTLLADGVLALAQQYFEFTFLSYVNVTSTF